MFATCVEIPYSKYFYSLVFIYWFRSSKFPSLPSVKEKERGKQKQQKVMGQRGLQGSVYADAREKGEVTVPQKLLSPLRSVCQLPPKQLWAVGPERKNWDSGYKGRNTETAQWLVGLGKSARPPGMAGLAPRALLLADVGRAVEGSGQAPRHVDSLDRSSRDLLNWTQTFMRKSHHTVMINFKTKLRRC